MSGWTLGRMDNGWHCIPIHDLKDHMDEGCECHPEQNEDGLWVHNSFDGREKFENGERKTT